MNQTVHVVILTGLSGAGKTVALQSLEDIGFFSIDNLPPALIPKLGELVIQSGGKVSKIALVCDLRGRALGQDLFEALKELEEKSGITAQILYLEADDDVLVRRYKETRRRHPMSPDGRIPEGIAKERRKLEEMRGRADWIIDTSDLKPSELKQRIVQRFSNLDEQKLNVNIVSFGFKHGVPIDADLVFDVRFLPNPHYVESLRPLTGKDKDVSEYVMKWPVTQQFLEKLFDLVDFLLPQFQKEGKNQAVIAIGCTGGQHRSVAVAELLYQHLKQNESVRVTHRDCDKGR
ncbi:nucleotide-binding protein YvcJ [Collibacillus ludicampi]|uniref:Nucleotide-binding protein YvcJ n=1 Tax=Collibacillus ludicampi TaxID=2771369 RepID=A0AAV4LC11_9BACL|nr:RNase adapter RapZ [Collibacillus ludicampi]GIM45286.1 nucleotide-binding protein YvcJ [Collibacillus ludicampi]